MPWWAIVTVVAGMAAAWIAAGSIGLLAHPLRHTLTWIAVMVAVVAAWPRKGQPPVGWFVLAVGLAVAAIMTASNAPVVNVLAVAVVLAVLAQLHGGASGQAILLVALAAAVLGVFRLACSSIPAVWLAAGALGRAMGWLSGAITGEPLWIGATFGGIDFLVLSAALYVGWLRCTSPPRRTRAIHAAAAILLGQLLYLVVLAFSCKLTAALPDIVLPPPDDKSRLGIWAWGNAVRTLLPWNVPAIAGIVHATIAAVMFRWATWLPDGEPKPRRQTGSHESADTPWPFATALLAAATALLTVLTTSQSDFSGKRIVAYQQGRLDWIKPEHDSDDAGAYGILPIFVESLRGAFATSADLSQEDLAGADVLLLLHPDRPWPEERLERVWEFVRGGGSLLLAAEPRILEGESKSSFNEVLRPTGMSIRYDTAVSATNNWEHVCDPLSHAATAGIGDCRNRFALVMPSSIDVHPPAMPLLAARWAFSEPGSDAVLGGVREYEPGKKLGDLVLAAEQRFGRGRIVVLGDVSCLHNDVCANAYAFTGRLLSYLANRSGSPQAWWRQVLGLAAMAALTGLLAWRATAARVAVAAVALAGSLACCTLSSHYSARVLPDGRKHSPNNLAYIDASHLEAYSSDPWHDDGTAGLARTLMRNGYLPLLLSEVTLERLERAGLLISIAPARSFSLSEREAIRNFVERGGAFICIVGSQQAASSGPLLADFGFYLPPANVPATGNTKEAEPLGVGAFRQTYVRTDDDRAMMQTYAAWEVECHEPDAEELMVWSDGKVDLPFVVSRPIGKGTVTVIGDTYFAANKNLEGAGTRLQENVNFWRWLLAQLIRHEQWIPPKPAEDVPKDDVSEKGIRENLEEPADDAQPSEGSP